jgi:YD repeat-containing protein
VFTYTYDAANRLITATTGLTTTTFVYNGLGDRVNQAVAGVVITYTLDLAAGPTLTHTATGTWPELAARTPSTRYPMGSVRPLSDKSSAVTHSPLTPEQSIPTLSLWKTPQSPQPPAVRIPCAPA